MTPAASLAQHRTFLAGHGEDVIIPRYSGKGAVRTSTDTVTRARVMGYAPKELVGSIVQGDRRVIALT